MKPREPEEEACGVWLDAAALKRRKVQTHLIKPGTKMLTLLPGERKSNTSCIQRRGTQQTSIASFVTLQPGMANGDNQKNIFSLEENQINKECKRTQLACLVQGSGGDCLVSPLATSTPADIQGTGRSSQSPQSSCLLDQKEAKRKREWLCGSKTNSPGMRNCIRPSGGKCYQPLDKAEVGKRGPAKENRQAPVHLQTYRFESWSRKKPLSVTKSPCPLLIFSGDSERNDRNSWSQLFTEDSQGQKVIAHNTKMPFQDITNARSQGLGQFADSSQAQCQDGSTQLHLQPNLLFTQDSEGNRVIRH